MSNTDNPQIFKKMCDIMGEIGAIAKEKKNQQQGFMFRGIDQFMNALYPLCVKHRVFICPRLVSESHEQRETTRSSGKTGLDTTVRLQMEYDFIADDGSKQTVGPIPGEGWDMADKATNKSNSCAFKYMLMHTFMVPLQEMEDADRVTPDNAGSTDSQHGDARPARTAELKLASPIAKAGADYVIPFGDYNGKALHQVDPFELNTFATTLEKGIAAKLANKAEPNPNVVNALKIIRSYLEGLNAGNDGGAAPAG